MSLETQEPTLHLEKNYFHHLVNGYSDIIVRLDADFNILYYNKEAAKFYEINSRRDISKISQELAKIGITEKVLDIARLEGAFIKELTLQKDHEISIYYSLQIISNANDPDKETFTLLIKDVTARREIEDAILAKKEELNRFIYRISHDLRGPVASMLGLFNIVSNDIEDEISLKYFGLYQSQAERLNNIILSLFKHIAIEGTNNQQEEFSIGELLSQIETGLKIIPGFKTSLLMKKVTNMIFCGDRFAVFTILHSLIDNSAKFLSPIRQGRIEVIAEEEEDKLKLCIRDNGIGIEKKYHSEIFQMFYRGNNFSQGSGLGLYLFKSAVEKLNASYEFCSKLDEGTTFTISIPIDQSHLFRK